MMTAQTNRKASELPSGDPALLNRISWARRWTERQVSADYALAARKKALDGKGRRSQAEQGFALRTLAWHALWRGDLTLSMEYCLQAESFLPETKFQQARAGIYSLLGKIHSYRNRFDLGLYSVERGLWLIDESDQDPATLVDLMLTQISIQRHSGERARAGVTLGRARELAVGENLALVEFCTANLLLDDGDAIRACEHAQTGVQTTEEAGNRILLPFARAALAGSLIALGKHLDAHEQISNGLSEISDGNDMMARCMLMVRKAALLRIKGEIGPAVEMLSDAASIADAQTYALLRKRIALEQADILEQQGDYKAAVAQHKIAWRLQSETRVR